MIGGVARVSWVALIGTVARSASTTTGSAPKRAAMLVDVRIATRTPRAGRVVRPPRPEQRHPLRPQLLVVEVGVEIVAHLDDGDVGVQLGEPSARSSPGTELAVAGVDEHDELVDARGRPVDHVRVAEMRRV